MIEQEKNLRHCAFTGHRPEKMRVPEAIMRATLEREIRRAIADGFEVFISGVSRGVDLWAAETVLSLKSEYGGIKLICAVPFKGFERNFEPKWQKKYRSVLCDADLVEYVSPRYSRQCFWLRNRWMVDHAALVIAAWSGEGGGTASTVDYARTKNIPVVNIYDCF